MNKNLPRAIVKTLTDKNMKISSAESCTGGLLSKLLTGVPGSSLVFMGGVIAYDNSVKVNILRVPESVLIEHGAVSFECARKMAEGLGVSIPSDLRISITGIAGPGGGTEDKPVGTVFIGISGDKFTTVFRCLFRGGRERIRFSAARKAMEIILAGLSGSLDQAPAPDVIDKRVYDI
ncbi:MAG: CinA family protein [Brevinematales bacterium]|jgi:nicotinamide-nucleotide amidase